MVNIKNPNISVSKKRGTHLEPQMKFQSNKQLTTLLKFIYLFYVYIIIVIVIVIVEKSKLKDTIVIYRKLRLNRKW